MAASERTLRELIEKWLEATGAGSARVQLQPCPLPGLRRCVCVEAQRESGVLTLFFFRHGDGFWQVFPPERRPAMSLFTMTA